MQDLIKRQDAIVISYNIIEKWAKDIMVEVIKKQMPKKPPTKDIKEMNNEGV